MIHKIKIATDLNKDELKIIDKACFIEGRTRANFVRLACLERAKETIGVNKNAK